MSGNDDELMIISPLDQHLDAENAGILAWIDLLIDESLKTHDATITLNGLKRLTKIVQRSGLGLAKGMYLLKKNWKEFGIEELFEDIAYVELGVHKHTVERYVKIWTMYAENIVPKAYIEEIQQKNIKAQIPIANALARGVEIDEEDWEKLASDPDANSVATTIRIIEGRPPRKSSLQIFMSNDGELTAFNDGSLYPVGYLNVASDDEPVHKAIDRLVSNGGVLRK